MEPSGESGEVAAELQYKADEWIAQVSVWSGVPDSQIEANVVHELLHITLKEYTFLVHSLVAKLPDAARDLVAEHVELAEERSISTIMRTLGFEPRTYEGSPLEAWLAA